MACMTLIMFFVVNAVMPSNAIIYYGNTCVWPPSGSAWYLQYYGASNTLIYASNVQYEYTYSPCNLSFYSSESDQFYALKRYEIATGTEKYLIPIFNSTYQEDHNQQLQTIQITYQELDESCSNGIQTVYIYFQCNQTIRDYPYYNVISAGSLLECVDTLFIQSPYGCKQQSNWSPPYVYECIYSSPYTNIILNTRKYFKSKNDVSYRSADRQFYYSPCRNALAGVTQYGQKKYNWGTAVGNAGNTGVTLTYSTWNESNEIQPIYDPIHNIWNFTYYGYDFAYYGCDVYKTFALWGCNCKHEEIQMGRTYSMSQCEGTINMTTKDLCIESINQCNPREKNNTDCIYYWRESEEQNYKMLNLTALTGTDIVGVEDGGLYGFIYTPCNNNFLCNHAQTEFVMAGRLSINQEECVDYLAIFDGINGFNADYISKQNWLITYLNGESCSSNPEETIQFQVTWKTGNDEYTVDSIKFTDCIYEVTISSKYVTQ